MANAAGPDPVAQRRPWEFDSPSRDQQTKPRAGGWGLSIGSKRSGESRRPRPQHARGPTMTAQGQSVWTGVFRLSPSHGEEAAQAVPGSTPGKRCPAEDTTRPNAANQSAPSRKLRVIACNDVVAGSSPAGSMGSVAQLVERNSLDTQHARHHLATHALTEALAIDDHGGSHPRRVPPGQSRTITHCNKEVRKQ